MRFLVFTLFLLAGCSATWHEPTGDCAFSGYLKEQEPALTQVTDSSKPQAKKEMEASFLHVDVSYNLIKSTHGGKGGCGKYFNAVTQALAMTYGEFDQKKIIPAYRSEEKKLMAAVDRQLKQDQITVSEEKIIFDYRAEAEQKFNRVFLSRFSSEPALEEIKKFVDSYTKGYLVLNANDPDDYQQFDLVEIAYYKMHLYLSLIIALENSY